MPSGIKEIKERLNTALEAVLALVNEELSSVDVIEVLEDLCGRIEDPKS